MQKNLNDSDNFQLAEEYILEIAEKKKNRKEALETLAKLYDFQKSFLKLTKKAG